MLEEYGSTEEGEGLTLVTGLVEDGNAAKAETVLMPGDAIIQAGRTKVEGLNYDGTIDALMGLPAAPAPALLRVKRLRKVPVVTCTVMFPPEEKVPDRKIRLYQGRQVRQMLLLNRIPGIASCNDDLQCLCKCGMVMRPGSSHRARTHLPQLSRTTLLTVVGALRRVHRA